MKKIIMIILLIVLLVGCSSKGEQLSDSLKFKEEYESLNDEKNENNGKKYRTLNIDGDNSFVYKEASDIVDMMDIIFNDLAANEILYEDGIRTHGPEDLMADRKYFKNVYEANKG